MNHEITDMPLSGDLRKNITNLRTLTENSSDITVKYAKCGNQDISVITCEGMVSAEVVSSMIYFPLNIIGNKVAYEPAALMDKIQNEMLMAIEQHQVKLCGEVAQYIMAGFAVILVNGTDSGIAIGAQGFKSRGIEQVTTHLNLRSSREGFNEVVRTNMSLLRRRVKSPSLVFNLMKIGDRSNTDVCLCYMRDKADPKLVESVRERLLKIELNTILEGGYIQTFLESKSNMLFSEVGHTERPDTLISKLYEGRIAVLVDGTPFAVYLPKLFVENFQTMDDYTGLPVYATIIRWFKFLACALTTLLPGLYIALANYHPHLFPNSLLFYLLIAEQSTPYPLLIECLIIHILYEIMREAGLRLPTYVGHVVSIVGGLVIGQIVVSAGLVGAPIVLIVAIASIAGFIVPDLYDSFVVLRFALIIAGGIWGLYGITLVSTMACLKLLSMSNHGVPYTAPVAPFTLKAMRDVFTRLSWRKLEKSDVTLQDMDGVKISDQN